MRFGYVGIINVVRGGMKEECMTFCNMNAFKQIEWTRWRQENTH